MHADDRCLDAGARNSIAAIRGGVYPGGELSASRKKRSTATMAATVRVLVLLLAVTAVAGIPAPRRLLLGYSGPTIKPQIDTQQLTSMHIVFLLSRRRFAVYDAPHAPVAPVHVRPACASHDAGDRTPQPTTRGPCVRTAVPLMQGQRVALRHSAPSIAQAVIYRYNYCA